MSRTGLAVTLHRTPLLQEIRHNPLLWPLVLVPAWPRQLDELGTFVGTYACGEEKSSGADQSGQVLAAGGRQLGVRRALDQRQPSMRADTGEAKPINEEGP